MILRRSAMVVVASLVGALQACGGSSDTKGPDPAPAPTQQPSPAQPGPSDPGPQSQPPPAVDHGKVSEQYPAYTPDIGTLVNNGGDVLKAPVIVTVTWPSEVNADKYEQFGDLIGQSAYWKDIVGEYGVGAATSGAANHVRMKTALGASVDNQALDQMVADNAKNATTSGWPAPTSQTIYILYLPVGTALNMGGGSDACQIGVGGYHDSTTVNGMNVAYAIVPQCSQNATQNLDESTMSGSHELGEASLDPHPGAAAGWTGFDDNHLAWEYFQQFQSENGDMCEFYKDSFYHSTAADLPFAIQRQWSNKSALAGHTPCVPAPAGSYFNVTPLATEDVQVDLSQFGGLAKQKTKGFHVAVGESKTIPLGFYSDGPSDAWTIDAVDGSPFSRGSTTTTKKLELSLDKTSGQNGEKAYLTVKVLTAGKTKGELVTIVSSLNGKKHYMPFLLGSM